MRLLDTKIDDDEKSLLKLVLQHHLTMTTPVVSAPSTPSTPSTPPPADAELVEELHRTRHVNPSNLKGYLLKLAKGMHPDLNVSTEVTTAVNQILLGFNSRVISCADRICEYSGFNTLSLKELRVAVLSFVPLELLHSLTEMTTETLNRYDPKLLVGPKRQRRKPNESDLPAIASEPAPQPALGPASGPASSSGQGRRDVVSRSTKAALTVAVARVDALIRETSVVGRLGAGAPVYLAAVLEYLAGDLLNLTGLVTKELRVRTMKLQHLTQAIREDSAYRLICADWLVAMELGLQYRVDIGPDQDGDTAELEPSPQSTQNPVQSNSDSVPNQPEPAVQNQTVPEAQPTSV